MYLGDRVGEIRYVAVNYGVTEIKTTSSLFLKASNKTTMYVCCSYNLKAEYTL